MNTRLFIIFIIFSSTTGVRSLENITTTRPVNITLCTRDDECTYNAYCHLSRCTCKTGFLPYRETKKSPFSCMKEASDIEDYCEKDIQCKGAFGTYSFCRKEDITNLIGKCYCLPDAHFLNGVCHRTAYIGDICEGNDNCLIKSRHLKAFCEHSRCICPPKHHPTDDGTDCHPSSGLGGPCINSAGCITLNAVCKQGICICRREYTPDHDNQTCLQVAKRLGDPCDEDGQCLVAHQFTVCSEKSKLCECEEGAHEMDGTCWKTSKLLEPCGDTNECRSDPHRALGVECSLGICQCRPGYSMDQDRKECVMWEPKSNGVRSVTKFPIFFLPASLIFTLKL